MTGKIPKEIRKCVSLQVLDLEENSLPGVIPDFLAKLRDLRTLSWWKSFYKFDSCEVRQSF